MLKQPAAARDLALSVPPKYRVNCTLQESLQQLVAGPGEKSQAQTARGRNGSWPPNHRLEVFDATDHISGCIANHIVRQEAKMGSLTNKPGVDTMDQDA